MYTHWKCASINQFMQLGHFKKTFYQCTHIVCVECICVPVARACVRASHPLFAVSCQLVLQIFGFELQFGPLFDLLLSFGTQLFLLFLHGGYARLQLPNHTLSLLQRHREVLDNRLCILLCASLCTIHLCVLFQSNQTFGN